MLRIAGNGTTGVVPSLHLTKKESELLTLLRQNAGQCLSRDFLLRTIWGYGVGVKTRTLDVHVQRLRRKLKLAGVAGEIQTILRNGYCWQPMTGPGDTRSGDTRSVA